MPNEDDLHEPLLDEEGELSDEERAEVHEVEVVEALETAGALDVIYDQAASGVLPLSARLDATPYIPPGAQLGQWTLRPHPVALWLENMQRALTRESYSRTLRDFASWLMRERDKSDPLLATFDDMLAYRQELESRDYRASTRLNKLAALSSLYGFLVKLQVIPSNPLAALQMPIVSDSRVKRAWTIEEIYAFFAAIPKDGTLLHLRDNAMFWLMFRNALRVSEVVGARIGDLTIKMGARVLELTEHGFDDQHIKRGQQRDAVLKPQTAEAIDLYLAARGLHLEAEVAVEAVGDWRQWPLFQGTRDGGPRRGRRAQETRAEVEPPGGWSLTRRSVWQRIRVYGNAAGISPDLLHPHAGRHTSITSLIQAKVPLDRVMQFSGHKSLQSVQRYIHASEAIANNAAWDIPY